MLEELPISQQFEPELELLEALVTHASRPTAPSIRIPQNVTVALLQRGSQGE